MNKPARLIAEAVPDAAFTVQDYARLMEFGDFQEMRVELVKGQLRKMMPSGFSHGEMNGLLCRDLSIIYRPIGFRLAVDLAIAIDSSTVRGADIAVVSPDVPPKGPVPADRFVLIVEVAETTLGKDLGEKLADYARAGVPDYWVADLDAGVMHVMRDPYGEQYRERSVIPFGSPIPVPGTDQTLTID